MESLSIFLFCHRLFSSNCYLILFRSKVLIVYVRGQVSCPHGEKETTFPFVTRMPSNYFKNGLTYVLICYLSSGRLRCDQPIESRNWNKSSWSIKFSGTSEHTPNSLCFNAQSVLHTKFLSNRNKSWNNIFSRSFVHSFKGGAINLFTGHLGTKKALWMRIRKEAVCGLLRGDNLSPWIPTYKRWSHFCIILQKNFLFLKTCSSVRNDFRKINNFDLVSST